MRTAKIYVDGVHDYTAEVNVIDYQDANHIKVKLEDGTVCWAIDNPFTGLLYADPIWARIKEV